MEFDKLNRWITLVANIGVVAGIFFLAIEMKQGTQATRIAARDSASQGHIDFVSNSLDSSILAVARQKAISNEKLTELESGQLRTFHALRWRHYERVFYLYQYGVDLSPSNLICRSSRERSRPHSHSTPART